MRHDLELAFLRDRNAYYEAKYGSMFEEDEEINFEQYESKKTNSMAVNKANN